MHAALITSPGQPPCYATVDEPAPPGPGEIAVQVLAAGLHPLARGRAAGAHYVGAGASPRVAGTDGVGRGSDGRLRYFAQGPGQPGTMAERTVAAIDHSLVLPDDADPIALAGALNPAMAAWLALRCRVPLRPGQKVLVLGATGSAGGMAVQIARHLGASQVIAAGRNTQRLARLPALGATDTVALHEGERLGRLAGAVDVVLDFVWGGCAVRTMDALVRQRPPHSPALTWIHVGSMDGDVIALPGALLRAANLRIVGSGFGSVPQWAILEELPALVRELQRGAFQLDLRAVPLAQVAQVWDQPGAGGERIVLVP